MPRPPRYLCPVCGKLLVVGIFTGWVEVYCQRCKRNRVLQDHMHESEEHQKPAAAA